MPLSSKGKKIKKAMMKSYGKHKGEQVFYAYESKHKGLKKNAGKKGKASKKAY